MLRTVFGSFLGLLILATALPAQQSVQKGRVKKIDLDRMTVTLTVEGEDREFRILPQTQLKGAPGKDLKEQLQGPALREGAVVQFKAVEREGRAVLLGMRPVPPQERNAPAKGAKADTSQLKPLPELGPEKYQGFPGGLYPEGRNERPPAHGAAGLALAKQVQPLDADGRPSPDGKIVLLSVGMSNTTQEFSVFKAQADADPDRNPKLVLVDGAQGGMTAARTGNPDDNGSGTKYWTTVDQRLKAAGVTRAQVQAAWIKQADAGPTQGFPAYAKTLEEELARIVRLLHTRFPNLKLVYVSSRTYGGYARTGLNPEPYAYESGFSVKWLIEQQLRGESSLNYDPAKGEVKAPWLSWGPYLWANGMRPNADGLAYAEGDFAGDGTHPSGSGRRKVAEQLLRFFKTDPTARPWFAGR
jgi:hypothetical protein